MNDEFGIPTNDPSKPWRNTRRWRRLQAATLGGLMINPNLTPPERHDLACEQADYTWQQLYGQPLQLTGVSLQQQLAGMITPQVLQEAMQGMLAQLMLAQKQPIAVLAQTVAPADDSTTPGSGG